MRLDGPPLAASGPAASEIGHLTVVLVVLGGAVLVVFLALFARALVRSGGPDEGHGRRLILWGGVLVPAVVVSVVLGVTLSTMRKLPDTAGDDALVIEVTGHQWWWEVFYPQHDIRSANEIRVPVDQPVELRLTSADVVHSFWVPALGGKLDLLPERVNVLVLEASEPGVYRGVCAEFCGLQHANMAFHVVATSPAAHQEWVEVARDAPDPPTGLAAQGLEVFLSRGCQECHSIEGTPASGRDGPDLTHIASRQSIAAGTLDNTTESLSEWITNPQRLKPGAEMPDIELSDEDVEALVAYLETLE